MPFIKQFTNLQDMLNWLANNQHLYKIQEIYTEEGYTIELIKI